MIISQSKDGLSFLKDLGKKKEKPVEVQTGGIVEDNTLDDLFGETSVETEEQPAGGSFDELTQEDEVVDDELTQEDEVIDDVINQEFFIPETPTRETQTDVLPTEEIKDDIISDKDLDAVLGTEKQPVDSDSILKETLSQTGDPAIDNLFDENIRPISDEVPPEAESPSVGPITEPVDPSAENLFEAPVVPTTEPILPVAEEAPTIDDSPIEVVPSVEEPLKEETPSVDNLFGETPVEVEKPIVEPTAEVPATKTAPTPIDDLFEIDQIEEEETSSTPIVDQPESIPGDSFNIFGDEGDAPISSTEQPSSVEKIESQPTAPVSSDLVTKIFNNNSKKGLQKLLKGLSEQQITETFSAVKNKTIQDLKESVAQKTKAEDHKWTEDKLRKGGYLKDTVSGKGVPMYSFTCPEEGCDQKINYPQNMKFTRINKHLTKHGSENVLPILNSREIAYIENKKTKPDAVAEEKYLNSVGKSHPYKRMAKFVKSNVAPAGVTEPTGITKPVDPSIANVFDQIDTAPQVETPPQVDAVPTVPTVPSAPSDPAIANLFDQADTSKPLAVDTETGLPAVETPSVPEIDAPGIPEEIQPVPQKESAVTDDDPESQNITGETGEETETFRIYDKSTNKNILEIDFSYDPDQKAYSDVAVHNAVGADSPLYRLTYNLVSQHFKTFLKRTIAKSFDDLIAFLYKYSGKLSKLKLGLKWSYGTNRGTQWVKDSKFNRSLLHTSSDSSGIDIDVLYEIYKTTSGSISKSYDSKECFWEKDFEKIERF